MGFYDKVKNAVSTPFTAIENVTLPVINKLNTYLDRLFPQDKWNWKIISIAWSFIQMITIMVLEIYIAYCNIKQKDYIYDKINKSGNMVLLRKIALADPLTVYHMIFLVAQAYQFYLIVDTLTKSSTIQLFAECIFNIALSIYTIVQYQQAENVIKDKDINDIFLNNHNEKVFHSSKNVEIVTIGVMFFFCIGWIIITLRLYKVFGWNVFKQLGADIGVKNRLKFYQVLLTLLKFDIFFFTGFTMQFFVFVVAYLTEEMEEIKIVHMTLLVLTFLMPFCGFYATKKENYHFMTIFILLLSISIGYMVYNLVDIKLDESNSKYRDCKKSLSFTCISSIFLGILTFILALTNFKNFPKGLKKDKSINTQASQNEKIMNPYGTPKRWSIE